MHKISKFVFNKVNSLKDREEIESNNKYNKDFDYFDFHKSRFDYLFFLGEKYFKKGAQFLDIGSLFGYVCLGYKFIGYRSYGLDLKKYTDQFEKRFKEWKIDNRACNLEHESIPFSDNKFDVIMASEVLEHFHFHPLRFLKESARILKPGGKLIITTPNLIRLNNVLKMIVGNSINWNIEDDYWDGVHFREFTISELALLADKADLNLEKIYYKNFSYPNISRLVKIVNKISGLLLPSRKGNLVVVLKKKINI